MFGNIKVQTQCFNKVLGIPSGPFVIEAFKFLISSNIATLKPKSETIRSGAKGNEDL